MSKSLPVVLGLGLLVFGLPALAQAPKEPADDPAEEAEELQQPVVRRFPPFYQSYSRPGGPWSGSYRSLGYYVLDEDGLPISRHEREAGGPYFRPDSGSGFGAGWDFTPAQPGWGANWNNWTGWGADWGGWGADWTGRGTLGQRSRRHEHDRDQGDRAPRPAPRPE